MAQAVIIYEAKSLVDAFVGPQGLNLTVTTSTTTKGATKVVDDVNVLKYASQRGVNVATDGEVALAGG